MTAFRLAGRLRHFTRSLTHRAAVEAELDEELRACVELAVDERVRFGESSETARRAVMRQFGSLESVKEEVRDTQYARLFESLVQDARFALRGFRRSPGFTLVAVMTLALGIGGSTAVFSIVDAVLVRPLGGVRAPERLVALGRLQHGAAFDNFGFPDFADYRARMHSVSGIAAHIGVPLTSIARDGRPLRLRGKLVTGDYFALLGARSASGRLLAAADDASDAAPAIVISHDFWTRHFGARTDAVGASMVLNEHAFTIVGVAASNFTGTEVGERTDIWAPLSAQPQLLSRMSADIMRDRAAGWLQLFARLRDGQSVEQAAAEAHTIAAQLAGAYPKTNRARDVSVRAHVELDPSDRADLSRILELLATGVVLVLLIACLNVSGLMVVRSRARRREMAVRLALGASRRRLVHQLVVEGVMLTTAAGLLALSIAGALANAATRLQPQGSILHGVHITLDRRVLALSAIITLVTAGLLALLPAFRASRLDPMAALKATAPGSGGSRHHGQRFLVGAQIALSFALLVTGLMVTVAMERLLARSPGFDTESLVMLSVDLSAQGYAADRGLPFLTRLYERLSNEPAFSSASFAKTVPPLDWSDRISLFRPGTEPTRDALRKDMSSLGFRVQADGVGPAYFSTLRLSLLKGREFTAADDSSAPGVVVVNQSLARLLWPDGNVIGQRISWPSLDGPARKPLTVVGVIADHRYTSLTTQAAPLLYFPVLQAYDGRTTVVARARGKAGEALRALERVIRDIDPGVPTTGPMTMKQRMAATVWQQRMLATWLAAFAVLALGMSLIGLFGVVSQSVLQRGRELSVRMALGASPRAVVASVVGESVAITLGGLAVGAPLAAIGTSLARRQLVGMDGGQLEAWTLSAVVLSAAILGASYLPARRATRLNPADALRCD